MLTLTSTGSTSNTELAEFLFGEFLIREYKWNFGTEEEPDERVPNVDELLVAFDELKRTTPEGSFQIMGHLIAVHWQGHFDIYLEAGELE